MTVSYNIFKTKWENRSGNPINIVKVAFIGLYSQFFVTLISSSNIDNKIHIFFTKQSIVSSNIIILIENYFSK